MSDLYGRELAEKGPPDSVMTTVAAVRALQRWASLRNGGGEDATATEVFAAVVSGLDEYLDLRWAPHTGWGGTLAPDCELQWSMRPSYRHTSWLLTLWLLVDRYFDRCVPTVRCLLHQYERVDWEREKVATPVAADYALRRALAEDSIGSLIDVKRAEFLKAAYRKRVVAKYDREIRGWWSGKSREWGRQVYTLYVLADLWNAWKDGPPDLTVLMTEALSETVGGRWTSTQAGGLPWSAGGSPDLNVSCLAASALLRKPRLSRQEKQFRNKVIKYVVGQLSGHTPEQLAESGAYSWTLSYFVNDACRTLQSGVPGEGGADAPPQ